jgi:signal peptidase I
MSRLRTPLSGLPAPLRGAVDWTATIVGAVAIVIAIKAWVVNPYRIPTSSMEPTLHCGRPGSGCLARFSDRVLADRLSYHFRAPSRGDIVVFRVPDSAHRSGCALGPGDTFIKRLLGVPGDRIREDSDGYVWVNGRRLAEPYVAPARRARDKHRGKAWRVPRDSFFLIGDNRANSCDSRVWGAVPRANLIGRSFATYWPPDRMAPRWLVWAVAACAGAAVLLLLLWRGRA